MRVTDKYVFFYTWKDFLSNFHSVSFMYKGELFRNSETALVWMKARYFGAEDLARRALFSQTPSTVKTIGRSARLTQHQEEWDKVKGDICYDILLAKFKAPKMKQLLLETGTRILVEASPSDITWGVGLSQDDPKIDDPANWKGENLLGELLMRVRDYYSQYN